MKLVIQKVKEASCSINDELKSSIKKGYMILVGIEEGDIKEKAAKLALKTSKLRIFEDGDGKLNLDIHQVKGSILSISQFTLLADCKKGNRPSFVKAMRGEEAKNLYLYFNECLRHENLIVEEGVFGADMQIGLINDGPTTIILEE